MTRIFVVALAVLTSLSACTLMRPDTARQGKALRVASEKTLTGFPFPESVGCDPDGRTLYVSQFVSALKPTEKDGQGRISRVSLSGEVLDQRFLPGPGEVLHKPKGIWVEGGRLWVTDIDVVWVFDLKTRKGRKAALPGIKFANDPAVMGGALYVSDNRGDALYRVEPADFLAADPKVTQVFVNRSINPNGVYPARDGSLLMVGFKSATEPRGIHALARDGGVKALSKALGRLDGIYEMRDGTLLVTDWNAGALLAWRPGGDVQTLASGFKGPADFCVMPQAGGSLLVVVPDLVTSELRLVQLAP